MGKMKELSIQKDNGEVYCVGCEFVKIMSDDGTGYCKEHGDIRITTQGADTIIEKLGGNELSLLEDA